MKNNVVFAAAGNGKTYSICKEAAALLSETDKNILLVSYTTQGVHSLETEYRLQNQGVVDSRIIIKTWYSFLLSELIKPYQCLLQLKRKVYKKEVDVVIPENHIRSIAFYNSEAKAPWYNSRHIQYFINTAGDLWKDDVSHLASLCALHSCGKAIKRLENIYSHIFFDELQDYAGWDLEILDMMFNSEISIKCVGDPRQSTYRTNNSPKNRQYRDEKIRDYFIKMSRQKKCAITYENTTRRFNQDICDYVNTIFGDSDGEVVPYTDSMHANIENRGIYIIANEHLSDYCAHYSPVVLRFNKTSQVGFENNCKIYNYGASKGATFQRVVIIPVTTVIPFVNEQRPISANQTRSKFYVACTRACYSIVFATDHYQASKRFVPVTLSLGDRIIPALRYQNS